jgi:hypothetical protein
MYRPEESSLDYGILVNGSKASAAQARRLYQSFAVEQNIARFPSGRHLYLRTGFRRQQIVHNWHTNSAGNLEAVFAAGNLTNRMVNSNCWTRFWNQAKRVIETVTFDSSGFLVYTQVDFR